MEWWFTKIHYSISPNYTKGKRQKVEGYELNKMFNYPGL